jgi:hypothetical protein
LQFFLFGQSFALHRGLRVRHSHDLLGNPIGFLFILIIRRTDSQLWLNAEVNGTGSWVVGKQIDVREVVSDGLRLGCLL